MATDENCKQFGRASSTNLELWFKEMPGYDYLNSVWLLAGVLFLDQRSGRSKQIDHVIAEETVVEDLLHQAYIEDAALRRLFNEAKQAPQGSREAKAKRVGELLAAKPYAITFRVGVSGSSLPKALRGKTIRLRLISDEESHRRKVCLATVDKAGRIIPAS